MSEDARAPKVEARTGRVMPVLRPSLLATEASTLAMPHSSAQIDDVPEHRVAIVEHERQFTAFVDEVVAEDNALTSSVQIGLTSGLPKHGRLLRKSEQLIIHFQKLVARALS